MNRLIVKPIPHGNAVPYKWAQRTLTVPVADVWTMADGKIKEYLIFVDNTEL